MKYVVTDLGPIDRRQPGEDVTGVYAPDVLARLIDEGYVEEIKPAKASKRKAKAAQEVEGTDGD